MMPAGRARSTAYEPASLQSLTTTQSASAGPAAFTAGNIGVAARVVERDGHE